MYKNTMYILTITSWLHSQWQNYIAIKIALWVWPSHNNSVLGTEHRTKIILSIEHQYKNYFVTTKTKKSSEKKQTQTQFFTVTVRDKSRDDYWNSKQKFNLILDIFFMKTDVTQTANIALQRYSDLKQS